MSRATGGAKLTDEEACRVVEVIRPCFDEYVSKYDERKYPPRIYENLLRAFGAADKVTAEEIRTAMLWKFGHLGKQRIPSQHEALISCIQERWPDLSLSVVGSTIDIFDRLDAAVGGPYRYITISFLLHLLRPSEVPIIDQFNFRAMNYYVGEVRPGWHSRLKPSTYRDLQTLSSFLNAIRTSWKSIEPSKVPSQGSLDRFLMTKGKALKPHGVAALKIRTGGCLTAPISELSAGQREPDVGWIRLPYGGPGAGFCITALIQHVKKSGRRYIIQGQVECRFSAHRKPQSLDCWLRRNFAKNCDIKQAVNDVIRQLVSSGLFEEGEFPCPDSGRVCKGVRLTQPG